MITDTLLTMAAGLVGVDLSPDEAEAILPYVTSYLETAAELEALGFHGDDPRMMHYADDARLAP